MIVFNAAKVAALRGVPTSDLYTETANLVTQATDTLERIRAGETVSESDQLNAIAILRPVAGNCADLEKESVKAREVAHQEVEAIKAWGKLLRRYEVRFVPLTASAQKPLRLRDIGSNSMGKFVTAECMVIRASDVKPLIEVAVYAWSVGAQAGRRAASGALRAPSHFRPPSTARAATCAATRRTRS
jgi:DNA replicative helicase MCM subunit Mcm2 (Cdc46/Mcm family)